MGGGRMRSAVLALLVTAMVPATAAADKPTPGPEHDFAVSRTGAASLPDHTIIAPAEVAWPAPHIARPPRAAPPTPPPENSRGIRTPPPALGCATGCCRRTHAE